MTLQQAALMYASQGRRVHPCRNTPEDKDTDKTPYTRWGTEATVEREQIILWWSRWPDALIGLCTGNGLVVVDDDRGTEAPDGDLSATLTASTRSRGWHHYFTSDVPVGNAVGLLPGIDVRGEGGYVIAPPSPGWSWHHDAPLLPLPEYIGAAVLARSKPRGPSRGGGFEPRPRVAEGGRNDYMARFAGYAIRMGFEDAHDLVGVCHEHNAQVCVPPLDDREVERTARSILRRHERNG